MERPGWSPLPVTTGRLPTGGTANPCETLPVSGPVGAFTPTNAAARADVNASGTPLTPVGYLCSYFVLGFAAWWLSRWKNLGSEMHDLVSRRRFACSFTAALWLAASSLDSVVQENGGAHFGSGAVDGLSFSLALGRACPGYDPIAEIPAR